MIYESFIRISDEDPQAADTVAMIYLFPFAFLTN